MADVQTWYRDPEIYAMIERELERGIYRGIGEFHLYGQGGHGFGKYPKETTSTGWFDAFYKWIVMNGFTKKAAA